jgi:type IV pilus biogenesis protein PilP
MQMSDLTTRQKVTAAIFVVIILIVLWQVIGLLKGEKTEPANTPKTQAANAPQPMIMPKPASLPKPAPMTEREAALLKAQQQLQDKYLAALNELQMLRIERDMAEQNKAIAAAKLDTVKAQKDVVDLLTKPVVTTAAYAQGLANSTVPSVVPSTPITTAVTSNEASYVIISVSQLQGRWSAVLGYQGKLFNVSIGDVLPADNSKVVSIDKSGVVVEKDNNKKKISLLPNI